MLRIWVPHSENRGNEAKMKQKAFQVAADIGIPSASPSHSPLHLKAVTASPATLHCRDALGLQRVRELLES